MKYQEYFFDAILKGDKKTIKYYLSKNDQLIHAKERTTGNGETAVTLACYHADLETVKLLEEFGADLNQTSRLGQNGLLWAVRSGKTDIINYLHTKNDQLIHAEGVWYACCAETNSLETIKLVVELGADTNQTVRKGLNGLMIATCLGKMNFIKFLHSKNDQLIHSKTTDGNTALTLACDCKKIEAVKLLVELGSDVNQIDGKGRNGLMLAAEKGEKDIIKFLHSINDQLIHGKDDDGKTAVQIACTNGNLETIKLLVELGAELC